MLIEGRFRKFFQSERSLFMFFSGIAIFLLSYTITLDLVESKVMGYGYYFSESLLFSVIWIIFIPVSYVVYSQKLYKFSPGSFMIIVICTIIIHILIYSLSVWFFSFLFMENVFYPSRVFKYGTLEYFLLLIFLYITYFVSLHIYSKNFGVNSEKLSYPKSLNVYVNGTTQLIDVSEILYFQAQTPYIAVVTLQKKYLIHNTLRDILENLDPNIFIRIHKSAIINLVHLKSYSSRQNGDYDLLIKNGDTVRMSRNFLKDFKTKVTI